MDCANAAALINADEFGRQPARPDGTYLKHVPHVQMTNYTLTTAQTRVGLSALKVVLRASVGALLRLSVVGKRTLWSAKLIVFGRLSSEFFRIEVLMI